MGGSSNTIQLVLLLSFQKRKKGGTKKSWIDVETSEGCFACTIPGFSFIPSQSGTIAS
jgi:hypothetical protein